MLRILSQFAQFVLGLSPNADRFDTNPVSAAVNMTLYRHLLAHLALGGGGVGTATVTVQASSDNAQTGAVNIPFNYRKATVGDTFGDVTAATDAGFTTTAGTDDQYLIELNAQELPDGKPWVTVTLTEVVDAAVVASLVFMLSDPSEAHSIMPSALT